MGTALFLTLRVVHVLLAAIWLGGVVFASMLLMPVIESTGAAGGQVMMGLDRKGTTAFFASIGGITVLTGFYLYWRFTAGFDPEISRSHGGMAFGIGGVAGLLALILGGAVIGRSGKKVAALMQQAAKLPDVQKGPLMQEASMLRGRIKTFSTVVVLLQIVALVLMAIAHYI